MIELGGEDFPVQPFTNSIQNEAILCFIPLLICFDSMISTKNNTRLAVLCSLLNTLIGIDNNIYSLFLKELLLIFKQQALSVHFSATRILRIQFSRNSRVNWLI